MGVEKFLEELKFLLSDLPEEEREEALDFYRCYFEDAGPENESRIISELESPEKVAYAIRQGLKDKDEAGEYTETGYRTFDDVRAPATRQPSVEEKYKQKYAKQNQYDEPHKNYEPRKNPPSRVPAPLRVIGEILLGILKVLLVIATVCIVILLIAALVALISVVMVSLAVTVGFLVVGIGNLAAGAGLIGVALIGISFIAFAVFLLLLVALVAFCKNGLAKGMRGITNATGNVVRGRKKKEA